MKYMLLIVAALALAFTVSTQAQTPVAPVTATSAQVTAQLAALGVTLPSDQTVSTISRVMVGAAMQNPLATPIAVVIIFAPNSSGVVEQESYPATTAQATAALAAGPALGVTNPSRLMVSNQTGTFSEMAR